MRTTTLERGTSVEGTMMPGSASPLPSKEKVSENSCRTGSQGALQARSGQQEEGHGLRNALQAQLETTSNQEQAWSLQDHRGCTTSEPSSVCPVQEERMGLFSLLSLKPGFRLTSLLPTRLTQHRGRPWFFCLKKSHMAVLSQARASSCLLCC